MDPPREPSNGFRGGFLRPHGLFGAGAYVCHGCVRSFDEQMDRRRAPGRPVPEGSPPRRAARRHTWRQTRMIRFRTDAERGVRIATFHGSVDGGELLRAYQAQLDDPAYDASLDDLVDLRSVDRLDVSATALRDLMALFSRVDALGYATRLAIVARSDLGYGLGRMYEMMRSGAPEEVCVFRDLEEAFTWLDADARARPAIGGRTAARDQRVA